MILKVNNSEYLDFNDSVTVEKQSKLFEEIESTYGDFSYSFELPATSKNLSILGHPHPNTANKTIYNNIECSLLDDDGLELYRGRLRVEKVNSKIITCSFFSGNYNWISALTGNMTELRLTQYDVDQTEATIVSSWSNTSGIVFPFIDTGTLVTRSHYNAKVEDFVGSFYLKTLFKEVFQQSGIKIQGELLNDYIYNHAVIVTNTRSKTDIENNSSFIAKTTPQTFAALTTTTVTFNQSTTPYYVGDDLLFTTSTEITIGSEMVVDMAFKFNFSTSINVQPLIMVNGVFPAAAAGYGQEGTVSVNDYKLYAGDVVKCTVFNGNAFPGDMATGSFKITPKFVYKAWGKSCVPLWTKQQFVNNVLGLFNTITDYNPYTKTLTINLFDKIKSKEPIDISKYITVDEVDYSEFISNYARNNKFSYAQSEEEDLLQYNISSYIEYGAGVVEVDNDFIDESGDVISSEFSAPISYVSNVFNCSLEKINFVELEEGEAADVTSITDAASIPRFNITDADDYLSVGDLVQIEMLEDSYNGQYVVGAVTTTYITVVGLTFNGTSTGEITLLQYKVTTDESVYIMINSGAQSVSTFSDRSSFLLQSSFESPWNLTYFNLLKLGEAVESELKQGMSFGGSENISSYQKTLLQTYWRSFGAILADPVKVFCTANLPKSVFLELTPLRPVYIKTEEATGLYYYNRNTGYEASHLPCTIELIKLP